MAGAKEIKSRIKSIRDTRKITNAMYLISSTKIKKARAELENTRPYFYALRTEIKRLFRTVKDIESKYLYPIDRKDFKDGVDGVLLITADKGLAGPYNHNAIKEALDFSIDNDVKYYVVGEYGRQYFYRHNIEFEKSFTFSAQSPTMDEAYQIADLLLDEFDMGKIVKIFIVYTDYDSITKGEAILTRLLPFHREYFDDNKKFEEKRVNQPFEFDTNPREILESVTESYLVGFIYGALVDSYCSELDYRMNAMNSANTNADSILDDLTLEYNRVRQQAITQEITEVSAGAKAMRMKRKAKK